MRESIFMSSLRAFFITLFGIAGLILGVILIVLVVGGISVTTEGQPDLSYSYTPEIVPNAEGVRKQLSSDAPVILKLNVTGVIGTDPFTREAIASQLVESRERTFKNDRVKAVLLHIDSPGGTVNDADGIYRAVKEYKEKYKVPVYVFADGICASGGVYVASAADKIFASDATIVGSVGVIMPTVFNFSKILETIGIQTLTIYDGKGKDNLNPLRPWKEGEDANVKAAIAYYYNTFVDIVTSNRPKLDKTKLINEYGANIFPAPLAKDYGYIDESGATLDGVIKELAKAIGIEDDYYQVVQFHNKSWTSFLMGNEMRRLFSGKITHQIEILPGIKAELLGQYLYLYQP